MQQLLCTILLLYSSVPSQVNSLLRCLFGIMQLLLHRGLLPLSCPHVLATCLLRNLLYCFYRSPS